MFKTAIVVVIAGALCSVPASASGHEIAERIDSYLGPYVQSGNFSGAVLVKKQQRIIFQKAYGFADREHRIQNKTSTQFHIASVSMQFTAAAMLRLVDSDSISLDTRVGGFLQGIAGADKVTIRDLLSERSGLPDINELPDYNDILQQHQTPASLVAKIEGRPLLFEPGSKFLHEEHSAYNLLALIVEKKTGLPFASALERLVLRPAGLKWSGVDDDSPRGANMAMGYQPAGANELKPANTILWSAKTGNASVYSTVTDEARFVDAVFVGRLLSPSSRAAVLDSSQRVGFGWFRGANKRFNEMAYYMNGRAPGFASFVLYLPRQQMTVVVFSNVYSSATTAIGYDLAAIALGLPYAPFLPAPASAGEIGACAGKFRFGPDFYQPNAQVVLVARGSELSLLWPSTDISPLIPLGHDRFMDRSYWEEVRIERDVAGHPRFVEYGQFRGSALAQ